MAHYAKVVDGTVTSVVVADDGGGLAFLNSFDPGNWIKTSFNTRGGIHYGPDGTPDGGPALRKNFAAPGSLYDAEADAFYTDAPTLKDNPLFELNRETYQWEPILANTVVPRLAVNPVVRLWVALPTVAALTPRGASNLMTSAGVLPARSIKDATHMFGSSDVEMSTAVNSPELLHLAPMSQQAMFNLTDRIGQQSIGIKVIPTVLPTAAADLDGKFTGPVFVKRRSTLVKDTSPLSYTRWPSTAEFVAAVDQTFWTEQADSTSPNGAFIVQPALDEKLETIDMFVSVNAHSELITWASLHSFDVGVNDYRANRKCTDTQVLQALDEELKLLALDQALMAGIHCVSYTRYDGEWCMFDWNLRSIATFHMFAQTHPIYAEAVAHMVGHPLTEVPQLFYETRCYGSTSNIPVSSSREVVRFGMQLRSFTSSGAIDRVACIGYSEAEVSSKFAALESWIAQQA